MHGATIKTPYLSLH